MPSPLSAKNAMIRVGGTAVGTHRWVVTPSVEALDVTNTEGDGYGGYIAGIYDAEITIDMDYDTAINLQSLLGAGATPVVLLYTNGVGSAHWTFASTLVTQSPHTAEVRGKHIVSCTLKATGSFSFA